MQKKVSISYASGWLLEIPKNASEHLMEWLHQEHLDGRQHQMIVCSSYDDKGIFRVRFEFMLKNTMLGIQDFINNKLTSKKSKETKP